MAEAQILIIDENRALRPSAGPFLERQGYQLRYAEHPRYALEMLRQKPADLVLTAAAGLEVIPLIRAHCPRAAVILAVTRGDVPAAVKAMQYGAADCIELPVEDAALCAAAARILGRPKRTAPNPIVGESAALREVVEKACILAPTSATVLIEGESGTGKDLLARLIHERGGRASEPLITVNCAAVPRELLESELFGHVKGAFTGATSSVLGRVELAHRGTLFLDEIGEFPLDLQAKLLRFVQEREVEKVGSRLPLKVDVRLIAATNRDLRAMVRDRKFREDLYYRLAVAPLAMPPLRQRHGDVPLLARHLFDKHRQRHGRPHLILPDSLMPCFTGYRWPGNVRELENVIESLVILARGSAIEPADLPPELQASARGLPQPAVVLPATGLDLELLEGELLRQALAQAQGNQSRAAALLRITRRTLRYRLEKHGIQRSRLKLVSSNKPAAARAAEAGSGTSVPSI